MEKYKWSGRGQSTTASENVYNVLYRNIISLNLIPGTIMSEKEIAERMGLSRTPVREAFIKLSNEALVIVVPQKGSYVSRINLPRVREERFLRESLEISVVEDLILNHKEVNFDDLYQVLEAQEAAAAAEDPYRFIELDDEYHFLLFKKAEKTLCYNVLRSFAGHYRRIRYLSHSVRGFYKSNYKHHKQILELIIDRNLEKAIEVMKIHLRKLNIEKDIIVQKYPDYFEIFNSQKPKMDLIDEKKLFQGLNK